jgi:hypothetical protein
MKLKTSPPYDKKDIGATICVVEPGDGFIVGHVAKGFYGNAEESVLLTFTAGPEQAANNVEIVIPESAWGSIVLQIAYPRAGVLTIRESVQRAKESPGA